MCNQYGIMPDVFTYLGYLAAKTSRIRLGTAVVTVPLYEPVRVVENLAFIDILSGGRVMIGLGSGYRPYEFAGFGRDFAGRHARQEEAIVLILELLHTRRTTHQGPSFRATIAGEYEVFPVSLQQPHPPLFMAADTDRSMAYAARHGFGLMLSTLPSIETLARQVRFYREHVQEAPAPLDQNPACGNVDVARWVYVAETDEAAKRDTEAGIVRHISHFLSAGSCTSSLRLFRRPANRVEYPSFTTCGKGFCHGLRSLFLPTRSHRPGVAVPHAPVGVAQRLRRRVPDDTGASIPRTKAPP